VSALNFAVITAQLSLDTDSDVQLAIRYAEDNPVRQEFRRQSWPFVTK
jgi:hypothetical protein